MSQAQHSRGPAPRLPEMIEAQLPGRVERYTLTVDGEKIHVIEQPGYSADARPVLLLHGNPTWAFLYRRVAQALDGDDLRLVMPDLLGLGYSDRIPADEHTIARHARAVGGVIDALSLSGLIFVGQDWGGPIGLRALCERPGCMAGLVVLNTVIGPPKRGFKPTLFHRLSRLPLLSDLLFRGLGFPQRALWIAQGDRSSIRGEVLRAYNHPLRSFDNAAVLALARMVPDSIQHASVGELERTQRFVEGFDGPSAIVWGDRDPVLGKLLRRISRALPNAAVTRTSAGHFLQEEVPEEIAAAVREVAAQL